MEDLSNNFNKLKEKFQQKAGEDQKFREEFQKAVENLFPRLKNPNQYIRDFFVRKNQLVIETTNKSFANELFLRKEQLAEALKSTKFKEIYIK